MNRSSVRSERSLQLGVMSRRKCSVAASRGRGSGQGVILGGKCLSNHCPNISTLIYRMCDHDFVPHYFLNTFSNLNIFGHRYVQASPSVSSSGVWFELLQGNVCYFTSYLFHTYGITLDGR